MEISVLSASSGQLYRVDVEYPHCDCLAFRFGGGRLCKHLRAASERNRREAEASRVRVEEPSS